jgi:hypothetical protein
MNKVKILINWPLYRKDQKNENYSDTCSYELINKEMESIIVFFDGYNTRRAVNHG